MAASQVAPSCSSPSERRLKTRASRPSRRRPSAMPTACERPWPSEPPVISKPGVASPTYGPLGKNQSVAFDEMFSGEIGQIGTQLDGLGHFGARIGNEDYFYNGFKRSEFARPYGLEKLGVEHVGVFFMRGVLLDVARQRNVDRLPPGYAITSNDLQACLDGA